MSKIQHKCTSPIYSGCHNEQTHYSDCHNEQTHYPDCHKEQTHVHETLGSVEIAEPNTDPHNHRFATVTGEVIRISGNNHIHELKFRTDFYEDHFHEFRGRTGPAVSVGGGRHVHFIESVTTVNEGHRHEFRVATLIEDPIGE